MRLYLGHGVDGADYAAWTHPPRWVRSPATGKWHWRSVQGCAIPGLQASRVEKFLGRKLSPNGLVELRIEEEKAEEDRPRVSDLEDIAMMLRRVVSHLPDSQLKTQAKAFVTRICPGNVMRKITAFMDKDMSATNVAGDSPKGSIAGFLKSISQHVCRCGHHADLHDNKGICGVQECGCLLYVDLAQEVGQ